jgi:hypothetical protein
VTTTNTKSSMPICKYLSNTLDKEIENTKQKQQQQQQQSSCNVKEEEKNDTKKTAKIEVVNRQHTHNSDFPLVTDKDGHVVGIGVVDEDN